MSREEKDGNSETRRNLEQLRKEIAQKGREIEQLKKTIEEMREQVKAREEASGTTEISKTFKDASELLDACFSIFGASGRTEGAESKAKGLFGLISDLAVLAEKSGTYQRKADLGKRGTVEVRVSSRPIRRPYAARPAGPLVRGKPRRTPSASVRQVPLTAETKEREPLVDIFEEEDRVVVMAEMPGVEEKDIDFAVDDKSLTVSTDTPDRKYRKTIELPTRVKRDSFESSYRNGILEIKLEKLNSIPKRKEKPKE